MQTQTQNTVEGIAKRIDNFNYYYEMKSCPNAYSSARREEQSIKQALAEMSTSELEAVSGLISTETKHVHRYFSNIPESSSNEPQEANGEHVTDNEPQAKAAAPSYRSDIFKNAWAMFRNGFFATFAAALKAAWKRFRLISGLKTGVVTFSYQKADGSHRDAKGTLKVGAFTYDYKGGAASLEHVVKYFDLDRKAFRSVRIDRLIQVAQ